MVRTPGFSAKGGPPPVGGQAAPGGHPGNRSMYYLYILKSLKDSGYYIGMTDDIGKRLKEHNAGKTKSNKNRRPFIMMYREEYDSKSEARKREIRLKKYYQERKNLLNKLGFNLK
ncbi:MAG: GIY-YIG nuclease family protein [Patescibacteria group bacterium]|nr:GIY-YIG nuclease family protein [Patescibacteria group bacterium]